MVTVDARIRSMLVVQAAVVVPNALAVPGEVVPLRDFVFRWFLTESRCYTPACTADVVPRHLSGEFLKPLRVWDYPNNFDFW